MKAGGKVISLGVMEASRRVMNVWNGECMRELTGGSKEGFQALEGPAKVGDNELVMFLSRSSRREGSLWN